MKRLRNQILFDESANEFILDAFDKAVDSEGYIVSKADHITRVLDKDGIEIHISEFAGFRKGTNGELIIIKNDPSSIIDLLDNSHN